MHTPHSFRRFRLADELGCSQTPEGGHATVRRAHNRQWLVLGLGPDPEGLAAELPPGSEVSYLECPAFFEQAGAAWRSTIPNGWRRVDAFDPQIDQNVLLYQCAMQLFPGFWGPVWAALVLPAFATSGRTGRRTVLVSAQESRLVGAEVVEALREEGCMVLPVDVGELAALLRHSRPDLFLSVNFAGFDLYGVAQLLLARAGVPVAVWCVDNPFHSLSGLKSNFWKEVHLFVTDQWFVEPLKRHGAKSVHHLPLAANPDFFRATADRPELGDKLLFVGRSAFENKDLFFSGLTVPPDTWNQAQHMLAVGQRPDFAWWADALGIQALWPGLQSRRAGFGADQSGLVWRCMVIARAGAGGNVVVCGDNAWRDHVDEAFPLLPCVDYYGPLANMYASARFVVGTVSPLLPHGLTQRHFDVWAAGGCLLTDATPGLDMFPKELTRPVTYRKADEILPLAASLENERTDLTAAWRELIGREHTYRHRIRSLFDIVFHSRL